MSNLSIILWRASAFRAPRRQLAEKLPQAMNLNAFPTTFILGRDGRVRAVHADVPSPGSGTFYEEAEREITEQVERLLAEGTSS